MVNRPGLWRVPKLWPGEECFILGGGPSLNNIDIGSLRGRRVIAVNQAFKLADWIPVLFYGDCGWLGRYGNGLLDFAGLKVTCCEAHVNKPGIKAVKRRNRPMGISVDPGILAWNSSSGACAINLAAHFGVRRIILLGYDMRKLGERCNWHEDYPRAINPRGKNPYPRFMAPFADIARHLLRLSIECLNATPGSALDMFPIVRPIEVGVKEKTETNHGGESGK